MDINKTHFHMLTGENDWEPVLNQNKVPELWWDREGNSLNLLPEILQFPQRKTEEPLTPDTRRGSAQDIYGNTYWIAEDKRHIEILPGTTDTSGIFWTVSDLDKQCDDSPQHGDFHTYSNSEHTAIPTLRGLAVTSYHYLVVGTLVPNGLLIFDLHAGGAPTWMHWPKNIMFAPFDLSPSVDGGVWILAKEPYEENACYWQLDRYFRVVATDGSYQELHALTIEDFRPINGEPREHATLYFPQGISLDQGSPVEVNNAIAIEGLNDCSVLILGSSDDESYSIVHHFVNGLENTSIELNGGMLEHILVDPKLKAHDFVFVHENKKLAVKQSGIIMGELFIVLENGNQAIAFSVQVDKYEFSLRIRPRYLPLRRFSGKALLLGTDPSNGTNAVYYDIENNWYPLTPQPRFRYANHAVIDGLVFDGKVPNCVWHRIVIDGCIQNGAVLEIESRSADEEILLQYSDWRTNVNPSLRPDGSEIPLHTPFNEEERQSGEAGTWEWLLQDEKGRYIELRLTFRGNGRATPRIRALRVYYPRFSYLNKFLPALYREKSYQANFLDRYLANVEGIFTGIESRIANAQALFDTRTAPAEYLEWLAAWLGAKLEMEWDDQRRRLFIDHAELMYRWRGTQIGLRAAIHLYIDPCPDERIFAELKQQHSSSLVGAAGGRSVRIVERYLYRDLPGVLIGDPTDQKGVGVSNVTATLEELGESNAVSERYRNFLYRKYAELTVEDENPEDLLNHAWGREFESLDEITFNATRPEQSAELVDWFNFLQRDLALTQEWQPAHGVYALHVRYQESLRKQYINNYGEDEALTELNNKWETNYIKFEDINFSPIVPENIFTAEDWKKFTQTDLGFNYAPVTEKDLDNYREFLARRYRLIETLNNEYSLSGDDQWQSFLDVTLPKEYEMPSTTKALKDWIQFVSLMLPIRRNAHRFTVLVPTEPGELPYSREQRLLQVSEIVKREKPAHSNFEVKLYWALFQVGSARLGLDTTLGEGSRYVAIILGATYMGQGLLASSHPWNVKERHIVDRDRLQRSMHGEINNE